MTVSGHLVFPSRSLGGLLLSSWLSALTCRGSSAGPTSCVVQSFPSQCSHSLPRWQRNGLLSFGTQNEIQQVLGGGPRTVTSTITKTQYRLEVATPSAVSKATTLQTVATTSTHPAVQRWYGGQKEEGCDKTACANCRWWYKCQESGVEW